MIFLAALSVMCYKRYTPSKRRSIYMGRVRKESLRDEYSFGAVGRSGVRCHMDITTVAVVSVILISYLIGSLTSSVETEQELPHRY